MPDDLINLEDILNQAENATPAQLQAMLPPATNPGAHAPATGNLSSDEIIAKQVNETPAEVKTDVQAEAVSSEQEVETETQSEQEEVQPDQRDVLFNQLRAQFPGETLTNIAARVDAAFATSPAPVGSDEGDILAEIQSEYEATIQAAKDADEVVSKLMNPEDGTLVEYTAEIRDAERSAMRAALAAESAFDNLMREANAAVENDYPELNEPTSTAYLALEATLQANPTLAESSPVALANLARHIASNLRNAAPAQAVAPKTLPSPTRVPAPAGPKPPVAGLSSSVQASHASAAAPAPGAQQGNDIVSKIRSASSLDDLEGMFFGKGLRPTVLS